MVLSVGPSSNSVWAKKSYRSQIDLSLLPRVAWRQPAGAGDRDVSCAARRVVVPQRQRRALRLPGRLPLSRHLDCRLRLPVCPLALILAFWFLGFWKGGSTAMGNFVPPSFPATPGEIFWKKPSCVAPARVRARRAVTPSANLIACLLQRRKRRGRCFPLTR